MDLTITIDDKDIAGLICTGFEGFMTRQWCRIMKSVRPKGRGAVRPVLEELMGKPQVWPHYDYPLLGGATICRIDDGETKDTDRKYQALVLDRAAIERGFKLMRKKYPRQFGAFLSGDADAVTGDIFLQLCLLGDVVYG